MRVLGWHGSPTRREHEDARNLAYHDAAAALLDDGRIVAAIEEERLSRVKHSAAFPTRAIRFCLEQAGVGLSDIDAIACDHTEAIHDFAIFRDAMLDPYAPRLSSRDLIAKTFQAEFGVDVRAKLRFCKHHSAHLHGVWHTSGFERALVICLDGEGDGLSGLISHCDASGIRLLRSIPENASLGHFYTFLLGFLGYQRFDEYKVMGLAPYGNPEVFAPLFRRFYELQPEGRYSLASDHQWLMCLQEAGLQLHIRRKGEPFEQIHKDFAAAMQATLERIVAHLVDHFQRVTGARHLCLSGGVAHNCALNGKILNSGRFDKIYVQPLAHDAGNALGAGLAVLSEAGALRVRSPLKHVYYGSDIGNTDDIRQALEPWSNLILFSRIPDSPTKAAELVAAGNIIAWVQGRAEIGPRALGNRSILADPRPASNKQRINAMIKKREDYRPFAPSVIEERLADYFVIPAGTHAIPFMTIVVTVRPEARGVLGAITHQDGTARVQSVSQDVNPKYHRLISIFGKLTGIPVVLNTSFNNHAEPIVESVCDALRTLLTTGIDRLIVGDWLVEKRFADLAERPELLDLIPRLQEGRKLVHRRQPDGTCTFAIESTSGRAFGQSHWPISAELYRTLSESTPRSLRERYRDCENDATEELTPLGAELFNLWESRAISLMPPELSR